MKAAARCSNGRIIYINKSDERGRSLLRSGGNFNPNALVIWLALLAERAWTHVIDVGANYGEMLVGVELPRHATTIALEPNPYIFPYLRRTLKKAGLDVRLLPMAASDRAGTVTLNVDRDWSGLSSVAGIQAESVEHTVEAVEVPATTLAVTVADHAGNPRFVRLLAKIDVESHEIAVLRGLGDALPALQEFAAMVEIKHLSEPDVQWLLENFAIELLDVEAGKITAVDAKTSGELKRLLAGPRFYRRDAVLRRRQGAAVNAAPSAS